MKGAEGNFVKINLKKKSHVKGYALRGVGLRKQVSFVCVCVYECVQGSVLVIKVQLVGQVFLCPRNLTHTFSYMTIRPSL